MSEWQDIATAPKDGDPVRLKLDSGKTLWAYWDGGLLDQDFEDCSGWYAMDDDYPPSWTDGVCWAVNESMKPSDQPTHWERP